MGFVTELVKLRLALIHLLYIQHVPRAAAFSGFRHSSKVNAEMIL
jgi:hypothetical protein